MALALDSLSPWPIIDNSVSLSPSVHNLLGAHIPDLQVGDKIQQYNNTSTMFDP